MTYKTSEKARAYGREYSKRWYEKNKEYKIEYSKTWQKENRELHLKYKKGYNDKNKEKNLIYYIKRCYGLTKDDYFKMFEDQEGKCLCCSVHLYNEGILDNKKELEEKGIPHRILHIDHDHSYNLPGYARSRYAGNKESVRGMLCDVCNTQYDPLNTESDWYIYCEKEGKKRQEIITQMRKMKDGSNFN